MVAPKHAVLQISEKYIRRIYNSKPENLYKIWESFLDEIGHYIADLIKKYKNDKFRRKNYEILLKVYLKTKNKFLLAFSNPNFLNEAINSFINLANKEKINLLFYNDILYSIQFVHKELLKKIAAVEAKL